MNGNLELFLKFVCIASSVNKMNGIFFIKLLRKIKLLSKLK